MGVDHHELLGILIQWKLLVCLTEVKLSKGLASREGGKQVFHLGDRVLIQLSDWINSLSEIPADSYT